MKGKRMIMETIQPLGGQIDPGSGMSAIFPPEDTGARFLPVNAGENTIVDMHTIFRKENGHA